ncbi:MAG TPA: hypothetical protein VF273_11070 [Pelobium sp.]
MKHLFTFLILQFAIIGAFAQAQSDSNYSIGLKLLSIAEQPKLLNEVRDNYTFYTSGLNGLMLKINDNQISYRFSGNSFKKNDYSFNNECSNCEIVKGKYSSLDLKMGFERSLIYSRLQPYYGMDFGYKKVDFEGFSNDKSTNFALYDVNIEKNGFMVTPFLGLKFNFLRSLTLAAEAGFDFIYTSDKEIKTPTNTTATSTANFNRWQYNLRPLAQLNLQFNFGKD